MKSVGKAISGLFRGDGKKWLIWLGLAGIAIIALTEFIPSGRGSPTSPAAEANAPSARQVEEALESRMTALLEQVEGVGACQVLVTLENGVKTVYAADSTTSSSKGADGSSDQSASENLLTVQTAEGPVGLRLTDIQPSVRGVAVVCTGGGDPSVREQVTQLISAAFHISSRRVCVVKQK